MGRLISIGRVTRHRGQEMARAMKSGAGASTGASRQLFTTELLKKSHKLIVPELILRLGDRPVNLGLDILTQAFL